MRQWPCFGATQGRIFCSLFSQCFNPPELEGFGSDAPSKGWQSQHGFIMGLGGCGRSWTSAAFPCSQSCCPRIALERRVLLSGTLVSLRFGTNCGSVGQMAGLESLIKQSLPSCYWVGDAIPCSISEATEAQKGFLMHLHHPIRSSRAGFESKLVMLQGLFQHKRSSKDKIKLLVFFFFAVIFHITSLLVRPVL